tara:strand:+ start:263 stop:2119 length:1857 start_codon:yes stop_codon:yes gene_type:complete
MVSANIVKKIPIAIGIKPSQPVTFTNKTLDFGSGTGNVITNVPVNALQYSTISINGSAIPLGGNINLQVQGGAAIVDTDTTYTIKASTVTGGANLDLDAGGSGTGTDSIKFQGGGNVAVSRVDANTILITDGGALGGVAVTDTSTNTLTNKTIDGTTNTLQNIPNIALANDFITINGENISLGGNVTISGGGEGGSSNPSAIETFTNKTMSGANNTFTDIANESLTNDSVFINGTEVELGGSLTVSGLGDVTTTGVQDLSNKSLLAPNISDAKLVAGLYLGAGGGTTGTAGQVVKSTGSGVEWANEDQTLAVSLTIGAGLASSSGDTNFDGSNGTTISVDTSTIANLTGAQTLTNKTITAPNLTGDLQVEGVSGSNGQTIVSDGAGGLAWGAGGGGGGSFNGPGTSTDDAIVRYDGTGGGTAQDSLVTIDDTGAIIAPATSSVIPFLYANQSAFPSASTYHGAIAHSHADGGMYFAHSGNWVRLANQGDVSLQSRFTVSTTTGTLSNNGSAYPDLSGAAKSYLLYSIQTDRAAWVRVYTTSAARSADASRDIDVDPLPGAGVLAEVITTQATTVAMTPATMGFNMDSTPAEVIYLAVTNRSGSSATVNVTLTILKTEI